MKHIYLKTTVVLLLSTIILNGCSKKADVEQSVQSTLPSVTGVTNVDDVAGSLNITGTNFSTVATEDTVRFNGVLASIITASSNNLKVQIPATGTTGAITVKVKNYPILSGYVYTYPAGILSVYPDSASPGDTVIINGFNFSAIPAINSVKFNGTTATVIAATTTQVTAIVPTGATTGTLTVYAGSVSTLPGVNFTVISAGTFAWQKVGLLATDISYGPYQAATVGESILLGTTTSSANGGIALYYSSNGLNIINVTSTSPFGSTPGVNQITSNGSNFYVLTNNGMAVTTNGQSWTMLFRTAAYGFAPINICFVGTDIYLTAKGTNTSAQTRCYKSTDNGAHWTGLSDILSYSATIAKTNDNTLYAIGNVVSLSGSNYVQQAGLGGFGQNNVFYKSTDLGVTWIKSTAYVGYPATTQYTLLSTGTSLFAQYTNNYHSPYQASTYQSTNGGTTWTQQTGIATSPVDGFPVMYSKGGNLYVAVNGSTNLSVVADNGTLQNYTMPNNFGRVAAITKSTKYVYVAVTIPILQNVQIYRVLL